MPGVHPGGLFARIWVTSPSANSSLALGCTMIRRASDTMLRMDQGFTPRAILLGWSRSLNTTCLANGGASSSVWSLRPGRNAANPIMRMCLAEQKVCGLPRPRKSGRNLVARDISAYMYTHRSGPMWHSLKRCMPCCFWMRVAIFWKSRLSSPLGACAATPLALFCVPPPPPCTLKRMKPLVSCSGPRLSLPSSVM